MIWHLTFKTPSNPFFKTSPNPSEPHPQPLSKGRG